MNISNTKSLELPKISIAIPVYNQRIDFFREALDSALSQTYPNFEVVVSDNRCTNEIPSYLASVTDSRLKVVRPENFLTMHQNLDYCLEKSSGEWFCFLPSDDWMFPDALTSLIENGMQYEDCVLIFGEVETVSHDNLNNILFFYNNRKSGIRNGATGFKDFFYDRSPFCMIPGGIIKTQKYYTVFSQLPPDTYYGWDYAFVFKLFEDSSFFYLDKLVAKNRNWSAKDGKVADDRQLEYVNDMAVNIRIIEQSPVLRSYLGDSAERDIESWKVYFGMRYSFSTLRDFAYDVISRKKALQIIERIEQNLSLGQSFGRLIKLFLQPKLTFVTKPLIITFVKLFGLLRILFKKTL